MYNILDLEKEIRYAASKITYRIFKCLVMILSLI